MKGQIESLVVWWNKSFPLDRAFRQKYKMPFNSKEHRTVNQVDVLFEFIEDSMFDELRKEIEETKKVKPKGLFTEEFLKKEDDDMFNNLIKDEIKF